MDERLNNLSQMHENVEDNVFQLDNFIRYEIQNIIW